MIARWLLFAVIVSTFGVADAMAADGRPRIAWRVENPFRLFLDPADTAAHRAAFEALSPDERERPILSAERTLSHSMPLGWAERMFRKTCWSSRRARFECADYSDYANPSGHLVTARLSRGGNRQGTCIWTITAAHRASDQTLSAACNRDVTFEVPYPKGVGVTVRAGDRVLATTDIRVRDIFIAGIGDSFASGDGNPDRPIRFNNERSLSYESTPRVSLEGYPARMGEWTTIEEDAFASNGAGWLSASCRRSLYSHQLRAALQLALEDPHRSVTFASFACWGSTVVEGLFLPMASDKMVPDLPALSQLSALAAFQCGNARAEIQRWPHAFDQGGRLAKLTNLEGLKCPAGQARKIDVLLVTIGGNDIGFSQLIANSILSDATPLRRLGGFLGQIKSGREALAAISDIEDRYKALNRAARMILHIPWNQSQRIILTSYPPIALQESLNEACPSGRSGMTVNPGFSLSQRRAREGEIVSSRLYAAMRALAKRLGWTFVDAHRTAFGRHGLCAGTMGALAAPADDARLPRLIDGQWRPYPPSQWEPYASRRRWIRTPNDSYLTTNFHVGKLGGDPINLILASSYSGAFHPTAEGQAAMADAVVVKARPILEKFSSGGAVARPPED